MRAPERIHADILVAYDVTNKLLQIWSDMIVETDKLLAEMRPGDPNREVIEQMRKSMLKIIEGLDEPSGMSTVYEDLREM